jgi:hypothetical protein
VDDDEIKKFGAIGKGWARPRSHVAFLPRALLSVPEDSDEFDDCDDDDDNYHDCDDDYDDDDGVMHRINTHMHAEAHHSSPPLQSTPWPVAKLPKTGDHNKKRLW